MHTSGVHRPPIVPVSVVLSLVESVVSADSLSSLVELVESESDSLSVLLDPSVEVLVELSLLLELLSPPELSSPEGAFYAFPRVRDMGSSLEFAEGLLREKDVGVAPGYTFGPGNEEHFRLCFAQSHERLAEALRRIAAFVDERG